MEMTGRISTERGCWCLIYQYVNNVFPTVKSELDNWRLAAARHLEPRLAAAAQASIAEKSFHCLGGSIYALYPGVSTAAMIELIVAYQTISDYLDNLADSLGVQDERAFRRLHLAMTEALDPTVPISSYYAYYPFQEDRGYLPGLVNTCRQRVRQLPGYEAVRSHLLELAGFYVNLQTYKHLAVGEREERIRTWLGEQQDWYPEVTVWELAAATGSTLGIFCLLAAACQPHFDSKQANEIRGAYFPWVCGLHILLDYLIDRREDEATGQLNFVSYYVDDQAMTRGLENIFARAMRAMADLDHPDFHRTVVRGLLAMYLSDPKTKTPSLDSTVARLLRQGGVAARTLYQLCQVLRRLGRLG